MNATNYVLPVPATPDAGGAGSGFDPLTGGDAGLIKKALCDSITGRLGASLSDRRHVADELIEAFEKVNEAGLTSGDAGLIKKTLCDAGCSGRAFDLPQLADELIDAFRQVDAEGAVL